MKIKPLSSLAIVICFLLALGCEKTDTKEKNALPEVTWQYNADKIITSQPTCANQLVFVEENGFKLLAIDATNGELNWSFLDNQVSGDWIMPVSLRQAVVSGDVIYWCSVWGNVFAIDKNTGKELWQYQCWTELTEGNVPNDGIKSGPFLHDNVLYVLTENRKIIAVNLLDGQPMWENNAFYSLQPSLAFTDDEVIVLENTTGAHHFVKGLSIADGQTLWSIQVQTGLDQHALIANERLYFVAGGVLSSVSLPPVNGVVAQELAHVDYTLLLSKGVSVFANGNFINAVDIISGETLWQKKLESASVFTPLIEDDQIYITDKHNLYILTKSSGDELKRVAITNYETNANIVPVISPISSPVANGRHIFVVHEHKLVAVEK